MPAYPAANRELNPQNTANDGDVWPNANLSQAQDYNLLDEELKAVADDLIAAALTEEASDITTALQSLRSSVDVVKTLSGAGGPVTTDAPMPSTYTDTNTGDVYTLIDATPAANVWERLVRVTEMPVFLTGALAPVGTEEAVNMSIFQDTVADTTYIRVAQGGLPADWKAIN